MLGMDIMKNKKTIYIIIIAIVLIAGAVIVAKTYAPRDVSEVGVMEKENTTEEKIVEDQKVKTPSTQTASYKNVAEAIQAVTASVSAGDYSKSKLLAEGALLAYPKSGTLHDLYSQVLLKLGEIENAHHEAEKATVVEPSNYITWRYLIQMTRNDFTGKQPSNAEYKKTISDLYAKALTATKNNVELITPYAIFLEEAGDIQGALTYWNLAITVNPLAKSSYEQEIKRLTL